MNENTLYYGDCLEWMKQWNSEIVDLIYLDPPFNSKADYNMLFSNQEFDSEYRAFTDKWTWDESAADRLVMYQNSVGRRAHKVIVGLSQIIGESGMLAYLTYMAERLEEMHRLLKGSGSIYLHCDATASHYLKLLMDEIFGVRNYQNEVIWKRVTSLAKGNQHWPKTWGANTDSIFFYTKGKDYRLDPFLKLTEAETVTKFPLVDEDGRRYKDDSSHIWSTPGMGPRPNLCYTWRGFTNPHPSGWRLSRERLEEEFQKGNFVIRPDGKLERRAYADDYRGEPIGNLWTDIDPALGDERLGYPTQKSVALMERIIKASSKENDIVFDPFCGCGTTIEAARRLNRNWVGIDISSFAIELIKVRRLQDEDIPTEGIPFGMSSARQLAQDNPFNFESWAISRLPGFHPNTKRVGDHGIDGRGKLKHEPSPPIVTTGGVQKEIPRTYSKLALAQVKSGAFKLSALRDFIHVMNRENAALGVYITLDPVTSTQAKREALKLGKITVAGYQYRRLQFFSLSDYFDNRLPRLPTMCDPITGKPLDQPSLFDQQYTTQDL